MGLLGKSKEREGDKDKKDKADDKQPSQDDVIQALKWAVGSIRGMQNKVEELERRSASSEPPEDKYKDAPKDKPSTKPKDLETLDRSEYADYILERVTEALTPLKEAVETALKESKTVGARVEIEDLAREDPDFWQFEQEMRTLGKEHPSLSVDELYALAKHSNPQKVQQLSELKQKEKEEADKKKAEEEAPRFLGFMPTSGEVKESDKMTGKESAEKAFEDLNVGSALQQFGEVNS